MESTLEASFIAFANCAGDAKWRSKLDERLAFFAKYSSKEEVEALPEYQARNEQERVMALQEGLLKPGASVRLHAIVEPQFRALNDCNATLIGCLRDGSFRCAVELVDCGHAGQPPPISVRARLENLRPAIDCGRSAIAAVLDTACDGADALLDVNGINFPLTKSAVGKVMATAVAAYKEMADTNRLPPSITPSLGSTGYPDLPGGALLLALLQLHSLSCLAHKADDAAGLALAWEAADELETSTQKSGRDMYEWPHGIRAAISRMYAILALSKSVSGGGGGQKEVEEAARLALRLNTTARLSLRKLQVALEASQMLEPRATNAIKKKEVERLQGWWKEELLVVSPEMEDVRQQHIIEARQKGQI